MSWKPCPHPQEGMSMSISYSAKAELLGFKLLDHYDIYPMVFKCEQNYCCTLKEYHYFLSTPKIRLSTKGQFCV